MRCIVSHKETSSPNILALCTRCHKVPIAYSKCNGISTMTKHVEQDHVYLLKQFKEEIVGHPWSHHDCELTIK